MHNQAYADTSQPRFAQTVFTPQGASLFYSVLAVVGGTVSETSNHTQGTRR